MTQLEKFVTLLDEMKVYYELTEHDGGTRVDISSGTVEGHVNKGYEGVEVQFDKNGTCLEFWA